MAGVEVGLVRESIEDPGRDVVDQTDEGFLVTEGVAHSAGEE